MALDRLKQVAQHVAGSISLPHPFDPLSPSEIEQVVKIVRTQHRSLYFNAVTLWEPKRDDMLSWLANPNDHARPHRIADVVAIGKGSKVYDGLIDLTEKKIIKFEYIEGAQPLVWSRMIVTNSVAC